MPDPSPPVSRSRFVPEADNLPPEPARLFGVVDQEWGETLRRSLGEQVGAVPPVRADLADRSIRTARRVNRRRTVAGLASVVAATVLATGAWLQGWLAPGAASTEYSAVTGVLDEPAPPPDPPRQLAAHQHLPHQLGADLVAPANTGGLVLAHPDGTIVDLPGVREVSAAYRIDTGWLIESGRAGAVRLWWVPVDAPPVTLLAGMDAIAVDGARVSWQRGQLLSAARLVEGELTDRVSTALPEPAGAPVDFLGDAVLLHQPEGARWDIWHPTDPAYEPQWTTGPQQVYGLLPDGSAVGLVAAGPEQPACLVRLEVAARLPEVERQCLPELADELGAPSALSPDGRWLLTGGVEQPVLLDLPALFAGVSSAVTPVPAPPAAELPRWLNAQRAVLATDHRLITLVPEPLDLTGYPLAAPPPIIVQIG